jgi:glycosyltransferase involved in cell wall biosynthesis
MNRKIIITSPSLDPDVNISGISSVTQFIINANNQDEYTHFELGKRDGEKRNILWFLRILKTYIKWGILLVTKRNMLIHFNLSLEKRSLIRDSPLIFMARIFRKRMIIHIHGGEILNLTNNPQWIKRLLKFNFSSNNPKVLLSATEQELIKQLSKNEKIFVLPNCIETAEANKFNREYEDGETIILLYLGRIVLTKGIEYLYQALKTLKEKEISFKFIMAGKGPDEIEYLQKFKELLGERFEFKGVVFGSQKTELLKQGDVFLLPSFFEGLPIALLESMSFGLVPVVTNVGSINYVVQDTINGILVSKYSSEDIVSAIERLAKDRRYMKKLSLSAREYVLKNYDPSAYIHILNKIYNYE